jgi:hypothetical protein
VIQPLCPEGDLKTKDFASTAYSKQIPGINLPLSHYGYYFIALLLSGVAHELGHAMAARL